MSSSRNLRQANPLTTCAILIRKKPLGLKTPSPLSLPPSRKIIASQWRQSLPLMGFLKKVIFNILHQDLGPEKKSARWVPKLLNYEQKQERVQVCSDFIATVHLQSRSMLECIMTMDETIVSYHTLETKKKSKQWIPESQPGPQKAWFHISWTKQMVLVFSTCRPST